jgi:hypothetical protein
VDGLSARRPDALRGSGDLMVNPLRRQQAAGADEVARPRSPYLKA